uniref:ATP synthase F(0) complex subunit e, mitochondrial n=1 Tax=Nothobranchius furzeri TaxID=105023 RepID=A0A8C6L5H0_NOTFU
MAPPVAVSPLIKTARYSALIAGIIYGKKRYDILDEEEQDNVQAKAVPSSRQQKLSSVRRG